MPRHKLVVMTKPVEGREREYNEWYQKVHLPDVVAIPGVKSAQRFRLKLPLGPGVERQPYLAVYDIETDDVDRVVSELKSRTADGRMVISTAMSTEIFAGVYDELGAAVSSGS